MVLDLPRAMEKTANFNIHCNYLIICISLFEPFKNAEDNLIAITIKKSFEPTCIWGKDQCSFPKFELCKGIDLSIWGLNPAKLLIL